MDITSQQMIIGCIVIPLILVPVIILYFKIAAYLTGRLRYFDGIAEQLAKRNVAFRALAQDVIPTLLICLFLPGFGRFSEWVWPIEIENTRFWFGIIIARYMIPVVSVFFLVSVIIYWKIKRDIKSGRVNRR
ncbi:MAG: hypothetical protein V6Z89_06965 [Desulfobacter sp.]